MRQLLFTCRNETAPLRPARLFPTQLGPRRHQAALAGAYYPTVLRAGLVVF